MSNPYADGPFWPLPLLALTKSGRRELKEMFFGGIQAVLADDEEPAAPADVVVPHIKCYSCDCTTVKNGKCMKCDVPITRCVKCAVCGQDQGLPNYVPFYHTCIGCGKEWVKE